MSMEMLKIRRILRRIFMENLTFFMAIYVGVRMVNLVCKPDNFLAKL